MDEIGIKPENAFAIVVGLDHYPRLGGGWRLDNAVREAREFTEWLIERGLNADRICLFLSSVNEQSPLVDRAGNRIVPRGAGGIKEALVVPPFENIPENSLLFVYWAGHGATDRHQSQLLFDPNYCKHDPQVFDLKDVTLALRSDRWQKFSRQIVLVNACANYPDKEFSRHQFANLDLESQLKRKQFIICAAIPGQRADDGGAAGTSRFFRTLLDALKAHAPAGNPLRMDAVSDAIRHALDRLAPSSRVEIVDWNGSRQAWSEDALVNWVYRKIKKLSVNFDQLAKLYEKCAERPVPVRDVREIVMRLEGENVEGRNRRMITIYGPVLDFVLRVIRRCKLADLDRDLTVFFQQESDLDCTLLEKARQAIDNEYRLPKPPIHLSFIPGESGDTLMYFLHDDERWEMGKDNEAVRGDENLEQAFLRILGKHEHQLKDFPNQLQFRFYLRVDQLQLALHEWTDPTRPGTRHRLEQRHCVSLGSLERARGIAQWDHGAGYWRDKARQLKNDPSHSPLRINWMTGQLDEIDFDRACESYECVGFVSIPSSATIKEALMEGLPFMIWPRQVGETWDRCRQTLNAIEVRGAISDAQAEFPRIRRQFRDAPFAVFWDDPDHNPYKAEETAPRFTDID